MSDKSASGAASGTGTGKTASRKPRKQYSCLQCQRRKQKCIFRELEAPCINCAKRYPPVDCVRTGTRAPQERLVKVFQLGSWSELPSPSNASTNTLHVSKQATCRAHDNETDDASASSSTNGSSGDKASPRTLTLTIRAQKDFVLDGHGDVSVPRPCWGIVGGILTEVGSSINAFHLHPTQRNTELLHYYLRYVVPNLVSIDGETQPLVWKQNVLTWQLQSPLMPSIAILMAATTKGLENGTTQESLSVKATVLGYINSYLASSTPETFQPIAAELTKCILSMVVMEWFWGSEESMRAHHRGIKEMLRLCGGITGLSDPVGCTITILTDYEIACGFEEDLCWQKGDPSYRTPWPTPVVWPKGFDSPLIPSSTTFASLQDTLGISPAAASILDDVRFLTASVTTPATVPAALLKRKIQTTASWLHERLDRTTPPDEDEPCDALTKTIRLAALVYSYAIQSLTPFSRYPKRKILQALSDTMLQVPLSIWKGIPGVYLWALLVLCPSTSADVRGKYVRRKMATSGLAIGFEDFAFSIGCLRSCWLVQRWVANGGVAHVDEEVSSD